METLDCSDISGPLVMLFDIVDDFVFTTMNPIRGTTLDTTLIV